MTRTSRLAAAVISIGMVAVPGTVSKTSAYDMVDALALQLFYMDACKKIAPPLPADRLREIAALREVTDERELTKALVRVVESRALFQDGGDDKKRGRPREIMPPHVRQLGRSTRPFLFEGSAARRKQDKRRAALPSAIRSVP
jgi:hypothetical protein